MDISIWGWVGFNAFVLAMLALDLGVFHRRCHVVTLREALTWSAVWIALAICFGLGVHAHAGPKPALEFFTGYVIEKSLSVDNVFIFAVIFGAFAVPKRLEHTVLFWGVLGALVMRASMIFAGVSLLHAFHWTIYVFGAILIVTGLKMLRPSAHAWKPLEHPLVRGVRRFLPVTPEYVENHFFVRREGRWWATPLFLVLVLVEATDLVFAIDSIPAILAVSDDMFIVYTSNVFAMLGLRSLYFALAGLMDAFHYLKLGLAAILSFVGAKMILAGWYPIPIYVSLGVILAILTISVGASWIRRYLLDRAASSAPQLEENLS